MNDSFLKIITLVANLHHRGISKDLKIVNTVIKYKYSFTLSVHLLTLDMLLDNVPDRKLNCRVYALSQLELEIRPWVVIHGRISLLPVIISVIVVLLLFASFFEKVSSMLAYATRLELR